MQYNKKLQFTARVLLLSLAYQLVYPCKSLALTTGPSQPEVQSFEPVGTTDMVDMFTGDFSYNIPLMDVEGYPVNISYHAGIGMEQESTWVGLGWNINPGVINRSVRGIPDDFNGENLQKELNIEPEKVLRVGIAFGGELVGVGDPLLDLSANIGANLNISNYKGVSSDFTFGVGVSLFRTVSAGVNFGVGSQTGADIDYNAGLSMSSSQIVSKDVADGVGINMGHGYNTRSGVKDLNFSVSANASNNVSSSGIGVGRNIPIGISNHVPVITNSSSMTSINGRLKLGGELLWCNAYGAISGMHSTLEYATNGTRKAYGYMYMENAMDSNILDFTRDKDGMFNKSMQYLPPGNMTYDVYAVSGQGTGGSFRPFRNDIGSVYDPVTGGDASHTSIQLEGTLGWLFGFGTDVSQANTTIISGPWQTYRRPYSKNSVGSLYENVYFKQGGELAAIDQAYFNQLGGTAPVSGGQINSLPLVNTGPRAPRANLIQCITAGDATAHESVSTSQSLFSYTNPGFATGPDHPAKTPIPRVGGSRKGHQLSEIVQTQTDGRRYVYGLPAMNNVQREVTFTKVGTADGDGTIGFSGNEDSPDNPNGVDKYYSATITPSYAHSYLLTSVLSSDYVDVSGNGVTDDDLGSFSKFNYTRKTDDYRWRAPVQDMRAQHNTGFLSDPNDDKASYMSGSRELWLLHSVESKNMVAEFYTSARNDGMGSTAGVKGGSPYHNTTTADSSYKLDSIKLYNKHDRFINGNGAVPIKTVFFEYDDQLCDSLPNAVNNSTGKLTLKKIFFRYGNSNRSMMSPYQFAYEGLNPVYNLSRKDRWGNYKVAQGAMSNAEYPFVTQTDSTDTYAAAWSLTKITLPSGGQIRVQYEADDYGFVQDKYAMEMFTVSGIGNTEQFMDAEELYYNKYQCNLYVFFERDKPREHAGLSPASNYRTPDNIIYYNFNVRLTGGSYEQVKGYGQVENVGYCADSTHGWVKLIPVRPTESDAYLHPVTYTTLNLARYNLPHIIFPGSDPGNSDFKNILAGLKASFNELLSLGQNPLERLVTQNKAKSINKNKSYVRLGSPGQKKKGGGHRVKRLEFADSWNALAGNNTQDASYGKKYDYTLQENGRTISSGVASYEPQIGGDENPSRMPQKYTAQSGSRWPPNDPVELYQETPLAESFYPSPVVGYRKVTVSSIHQQTGRSSQGVDVYQFYTAQDFPITVTPTPLQASQNESEFSLFEQKNIFEATQGYTVTLNDMHGKPKSVHHYVRKFNNGNSSLEAINYQIYKYSEGGGALNNYVNVLRQENVNGEWKMKKVMAMVGVDMDVTVDSREKKEHTTTGTFNANLNVTTVVVVPIPIPLGFPWEGESRNEFRSAVATKVVQQYGLIRQVENFNEGALTIMTNEVYDAVSGQPIITSVTNEFKDKEYTVNYPAYWGYQGMGPAYVNAGYEDYYDNAHLQGTDELVLLTGDKNQNYKVGDELLITYTYESQTKTCIAYVKGFIPISTPIPPSTERHCCYPLVEPKFKSSWITPPPPALTDSFRNISIKVLRSGCKNLLNETIQAYTTLDDPFANDTLRENLTGLISIQAREFSEDDAANTAATGVSNNLSAFSSGIRGLFRLTKEYSYHKNRAYGAATMRKAGLFNAIPLWKTIQSYDPACAEGGSPPNCGESMLVKSYMETNLNNNSGWKIMREITKWTPFGGEVENVNAVGNYSTVVFGYNEALPVAVAYNARQGEVLAEGFEDYKLLVVIGNMLHFKYSPFQQYFVEASIGSTTHAKLKDSTTGFTLSRVAHSGTNSIKRTAAAMTVNMPVAGSTPTIYHSFIIAPGKSYVLSYWVRKHFPVPTDPTLNLTITPGNATVISTKYSNIIEGWQQVTTEFAAPASGTVDLALPANCYIDDIRIFPGSANMKSYVYNPVTEKLMATLDENNYATFYEYDQEGNLVRTKKETERGIVTISESRSANHKN